MSQSSHSLRALVTGGTRGIGAAIAQHLKEQGYEVIANYHHNHKAAQAFTAATHIPTYAFDVCDFKACQEALKTIENNHGPVDVLVNNAGITQDVMFHKMTWEQWHHVIHTNLTSCFNMTRSVIEGMRERAFGRIIMVSSINGQKGQLGQVNYTAAKAGLMGFAKSLALESARKGITVNVVAPGYIETDMVAAVSPEVMKNILSHIPVGRLGQAEEIARLVAFLASPHSGFITGGTFSINGGQYMS